MTAEEYPKQLPQMQIPPDNQPGDAPESAAGIETGPPGMPLFGPASHTVQGSIDNAMQNMAMSGETAIGFGGHVGFPIPNMPDAQLPPEMNAAMGNREMAP